MDNALLNYVEFAKGPRFSGLPAVAIVSRHEPTHRQLTILRRFGLHPVHVGDVDAYGNLDGIMRYDFVVVANCVLMARLVGYTSYNPDDQHRRRTVLVFKNEARPEVGGPATFYPSQLHMIRSFGVDDGIGGLDMLKVYDVEEEIKELKLAICESENEGCWDEAKFLRGHLAELI